VCDWYRTFIFRLTCWHWLFFLIGIEGGGVQLGPLGTSATNRPIVSAPGDYDEEIGGMMIGRGNRSTRRKPARVSLSTTNPTCCPDVDPGRHGGRPATNCLSYGTAHWQVNTAYQFSDGTHQQHLFIISFLITLKITGINEPPFLIDTFDNPTPTLLF
jgi:hypothetical protein